MTMIPASKRIYDRGEDRFKHCWSNPYPGFLPGRRGHIGKCSKRITDAIATELLQTGIHDEADINERDDGGIYPSKVYNVHQGTIYVAVPTQPGISFHGYPVQGRLPRKLLKRLRELAEAHGCLREYDKWVKEYIV